MSRPLFETELKVYEREKERLLGEHEGQFVLIKGNDLVGTFVSDEDAIDADCQRFGNVPFLVKKIERIETPVNLTSFLMGV